MSQFSDERVIASLGVIEDGTQALVGRIAELEAENEKLKVCGNCSLLRHDIENGTRCRDSHDPDEEYVKVWHHCHFTPPRWTGRGK